MNSYFKLNLSAQKLLPTDLPLVDDNSDFTLHGYQNFLIEPNVRSETVLTTLFHEMFRLTATTTSSSSSTQPSITSDTGMT